jgi:hypothetical protein
MDGYGYGHMGWGAWTGMSIAITLWTALIVALAVWVVRTLAPHDLVRPAGLDERLAALERDVARLREQDLVSHDEGAGSRR